MKQRDRFVEQVRQRGGIVFPEYADAAVDAVFGVLAQRDLGGQEQHLAAQLPAEVRASYTRDQAFGEHFSAGEFLARIGMQLGRDESAANLASRAVLSSAAATVIEDDPETFASMLPKDFAWLCQLDMP